MKKGNVIDLVMYRNRCNQDNVEAKPAISKELEKAIDNLIHRLRELGPIQQSS